MDWSAVDTSLLPKNPGDDSPVWRDAPSSRLDFYLGGFRWWRRRRGGHWELWLMDPPVMDDIWMHPVQCSLNTRGQLARHPGLGFMPSRCEDYS